MTYTDIANNITVLDRVIAGCSLCKTQFKDQEKGLWVTIPNADSKVWTGELPRIMIVGEAPSRVDFMRKQSFCDDSGIWLKSKLQDHTLDWADLYLTTVCKCWPHTGSYPGPTEDFKVGDAEAVKCCQNFLFAEIRHFKPHLIMVMGEVGFSLLVSARQNHGMFVVQKEKKFFNTMFPGHICPVIGTVLPSVLMKLNSEEAYFVQEFDEVLDVVKDWEREWEWEGVGTDSKSGSVKKPKKLKKPKKEVELDTVVTAEEIPMSSMQTLIAEQKAYEKTHETMEIIDSNLALFSEPASTITEEKADEALIDVKSGRYINAIVTKNDTVISEIAEELERLQAEDGEDSTEAERMREEAELRAEEKADEERERQLGLLRAEAQKLKEAQKQEAELTRQEKPERLEAENSILKVEEKEKETERLPVEEVLQSRSADMVDALAMAASFTIRNSIRSKPKPDIEKSIEDSFSSAALREALNFVNKKELPIPEMSPGRMQDLEFPHDISNLTDEDLTGLMGVYTELINYVTYELAKVEIEKNARQCAYNYEKALITEASSVKGDKLKSHIEVKLIKKKVAVERVKSQFTLTEALLKGYDQSYKVLSRELTKRGFYREKPNF